MLITIHVQGFSQGNGQTEMLNVMLELKIESIKNDEKI